MAFNPTVMQQKAIETRGNILVSAAAGSGKTAVLVERVINMLTDKTSPTSADRLLIVTFTNAAAAEMRSRIEKRLFEEIQKNPNDESLQRQKYLLQSADICTIDSFCIKLVRENFEKCGIEPDFKISDGSSQKSLCTAVMSKLIAEYLEDPSEDFLRLLELTNCEYDEANLTELVDRLYLYSQQLPFPEKFINELLLPYETPFGEGNIWYDMAFKIAAKHLQTAQNSAQKMSDVAPYINKNTDKHIADAESICGILDELLNLVGTKNWDTFAEKINTISFERAPGSSKDDENGAVYKANRETVKLSIKELAEIFYAVRQDVQQDISIDRNAVKLLTEIVGEYGKRLFEAFCKENSFTFYNMEQLALGLLCEYKDGEIVIRDEAKVLCNRYDEVLVDEFQDVNDLQNMLFYVLSNQEEKLFVVGDVKQSIYGFRGSNPDNFLAKKNAYIAIENADNNDSKKIILSDNFRSRDGVCKAVNFFFSHLMAGQCGSIVYNEEEQLNAGGTFPESNAATTEILAIDKYGDDTEDSLLEFESQQIAQYIISVMNEGNVVSDGDKLRPARFCDFAILLDKVKDKASIIADGLTEQGIPVSLGGEAFMQSSEISTMMSLLQVIDNPKCDVELLNVMMSPIFCFTAEEMAIIRANKKRGPLYSAVVAYSKTGDEKTVSFIKKLAEFRRDAAVMSVDALVSKLMHSTDIINCMSARPGGKTRRANLYSLINFAKSFVSYSNAGIYGFIKYINALPENSFKNTVAGGENAVKIMSMHNSKGLQFPICIIGDLASKINNADSISRILFSEKGGIAFKYYDENMGYDYETLGHTLISDFARIKTIEEKLRLLYVAMTRAVDRLCLVCSAKDLDKKLNKMSSLLLSEQPYISREFLEKSTNMGDWILSCALLHPEGEKLCKYCDAVSPHIETDSELVIKIVNEHSKADDVLLNSDAEPKQYNPDFVAKIKRNAEFIYPYDSLRNIQAKASVSAIVHSAENDRFAFCDKPAFMLGDKLAGAARGTAMHHVMQYINFAEKVDVNAEIERLLEWKFITKQEANSIDVAAISAFFESNVYQRIMQSDEVRREMRFLTEIPAVEIDNTLDLLPDDASVIVQGAVDLCFVEDDGIVVLDFKTDRVDNLKELISTYGEQLEIYSAAAQKIFGKTVKERIIYSFHLNDSISF